jgi:hypothetical protein
MLDLVLGYQLSVEQVRSISVNNVDLQQDNYLDYANTRGLIEPIYPNFNKPSPILEEQLVEMAANHAKAAKAANLPVKAARAADK